MREIPPEPGVDVEAIPQGRGAFGGVRRSKGAGDPGRFQCGHAFQQPFIQRKQVTGRQARDREACKERGLFRRWRIRVQRDLPHVLDDHLPCLALRPSFVRQRQVDGIAVLL